MQTSYEKAQSGIVLLKSAVYELLSAMGENGIRNVDVGRRLGVYAGHIGHEGHIPRTILELLKSEGVAEQRNDKKWYLKAESSNDDQVQGGQA